MSACNSKVLISWIPTLIKEPFGGCRFIEKIAFATDANMNETSGWLTG